MEHSKTVDSGSVIENSQAGSQTGGAQAGAGQATQGSGASTGAGQAGVGAQYQSAGAEVTSDIGQAEASINSTQRIVAAQLDLDAQLRQIAVTSAQRLARNAEDFDGQLRSFALNALAMGQTALQNSVALANRVNNDGAASDSRRGDNAETHDKQCDAIGISERERTVRGGDAGDVIRWAALSENPVFQDAISAAVAAAVAKAKAN